MAASPPISLLKQKWQTCKDSNLNKVNQNHLCYRYTTGLRLFYNIARLFGKSKFVGAEKSLGSMYLHIPSMVSSASSRLPLLKMVFLIAASLLLGYASRQGTSSSWRFST